MPADPWGEFTLVSGAPTGRPSAPAGAPATRGAAPAADPWSEFTEDAPAAAPAPEPPAGPEGSAVGRFFSNWWENVNPVEMVKGVYGMVRHPVDTIEKGREASQAQFEQAFAATGDFGDQRAAVMRGERSPFTSMADLEAAGRGLAGWLPFVGPGAAKAGEQIGAGDIAGGLGAGVGMITPIQAPKVARGAANVADVAGLPAKLEAGAAARVADVMSPKVGANKTRFGGMADDVAPVLAKDLAANGAPLTRSKFHAQVQAKLADAERMLDDASNARLATKTFSVKEIVSGLEAARAKLTSKAVGRGKDVVPAPNRARVAMIDQALAEVKKVKGPFVNYEAMRTLRQAYDGPAKTIYSPSMTADFLKVKGGALGAADVTAVLRKQLAKWDPQTAAANAQYSLYRSADDVLRATAEVERVRPKVGRQIIARMAGTILGHEAGGVPGAAAGYVAGPLVDGALAAGFTTQLKTAALMQRLADAIEKGDVGRVNSLTHDLKKLGATVSVQAGREQSAPTRRPLQPATARP